MRRFALTGSPVLIGRAGQDRVAKTIRVGVGKLAVVADDDPRVADLLRSPFLREVDEDGKPIGKATTKKPRAPKAEAPASDSTEGAASDEKSTTGGGTEPSAESAGV